MSGIHDYLCNFGYSVHMLQSPTRLVVHFPGTGVAYIVILPNVIWMSIACLFPKNVTKKGKFALIGSIVVIGLFGSIWSAHCSSLTLDRSARTAIVEKYDHLHVVRETVPLHAIANASVYEYGEGMNCLNLIFSNGTVMPMTDNTDIGDKYAAAEAINAFLSNAENIHQSHVRE
jgi:hypothetical protein